MKCMSKRVEQSRDSQIARAFLHMSVMAAMLTLDDLGVDRDTIYNFKEGQFEVINGYAAEAGPNAHDEILLELHERGLVYYANQDLLVSDILKRREQHDTNKRASNTRR